MKVTKEISTFDELKLESWGGALQTIKIIEENNKRDEFMCLLEDIFFEAIDEVDLNDFIWFEDNYIFETLEIDIKE